MSKEMVRVASIKDLPEGTVKTVQAGNHKLALCRYEGNFYAVGDLCTHDNGPLGEGELLDGQIECPRHGARFDIKTGQALCLPAVLPIPTYKLEVRGQDLFVSLSPETKTP